MSTEKRLLLASILSAVVLFAWVAMTSPPPKDPAPNPALVDEAVGDEIPDRDDPDSRGAAGTPGAGDPDSSAEAPADPRYETRVADAEQTILLETDQHRVRLSNRGGRIESWRIRSHSDSAGDPLELVPEWQEDIRIFPLAVDLDDAGLADLMNGGLYQVEQFPVEGGKRVVFRWSDGRGLEVEKSLTLLQGETMAGVTLDVRDRGRRLPARLFWGPGFGAQDSQIDRTTYYYSGQLVYRNDGEVTRKAMPKRFSVKKAIDEQLSGDVDWVGLEDQYFAALFVPGSDRSTFDVQVRELTPTEPLEEGEEIEKAKSVAVSVAIPEEGVRLYVGAKKFDELRAEGSKLEDAVWFSSFGFLGAITKFVFQGLMWIYANTIQNYGVAIMLTTLLLRIVLFPLNQYSMISIKKSQLQMSKMQPKVNAIRNRYKKQKDVQARNKMNQEVMELYRSEGVNPMGGLTGCLPMLAQFPILIGFYNMLTVAVELRGAPFFGWIQDLSVADPWKVTPLLMGATMGFQQWMAMSKVTDPQQRQQQKIMMFMPFFFTWICLSLPAGLVLYWFVNNLLGIGQQWIVNRRTEKLTAAATQKA